MKKFLFALPFLAAILIPLGCKLPPGYVPPTPPTATPTSIPATATPTATATASSTPTSFPTFSFTPLPTPTVPPGSICGFTIVSVPYNTTPTNLAALQVPDLNSAYHTYTVIRNYADWQNWCGTSTPPAPPVNFATDMLIEIYLQGGCMGNATLTNVCVEPTQVAFFIARPTTPPLPCWYISMIPIWVAVPQNNLPIATY